MKKLIFIFLLFSFIKTEAQTTSKKTRVRTTYFSETNDKLRTVDSFSADGLLLWKKRYDYSSMPTVKQGPVKPGPVKLLCQIAYTYDSLQRLVYEDGSSFWCGTWCYVYEDSGKIVRKQHCSETNKKCDWKTNNEKWKDEEKLVFNKQGDTCFSFQYGNPQSENPTDGERFDFAYENGKRKTVSCFKIDKSPNLTDTVQSDWHFTGEQEYYYSTFAQPDSIVFYGYKRLHEGTSVFSYSTKGQKIKEISSGYGRTTQYEWKYDEKGNCISSKFSSYQDGKFLNGNIHFVKYNKFGQPEKEYTPGVIWRYRRYTYTYY